MSRSFEPKDSSVDASRTRKNPSLGIHQNYPTTTTTPHVLGVNGPPPNFESADIHPGARCQQIPLLLLLLRRRKLATKIRLGSIDDETHNVGNDLRGLVRIDDVRGFEEEEEEGPFVMRTPQTTENNSATNERGKSAFCSCEEAGGRCMDKEKMSTIERREL